MLLDLDQFGDAAPGHLEHPPHLRVVERLCSAVACTSTNPPAPVITTFMSTSACESSS